MEPPSIAGSGPAMLFDLDNYVLTPEAPAADDIGLIEVPGLDDIDAEMNVPFNKASFFGQSIYNTLNQSASLISSAEIAANIEQDEHAANPVQGVVDGALSWLAEEYPAAGEETPQEAYQPLPTLPTAPVAAPTPEQNHGDNQGPGGLFE